MPAAGTARPSSKTSTAKRCSNSGARLRLELEGVLKAMTAALLNETVEHGWRGPIARREVLIVVARHAAEHLGQAELTRDLALASNSS